MMTFQQQSNRREFVKTLGLGLALTTAPGLLMQAEPVNAQTAQDMITRKIPRTGEVLPAIGLGTYLTFDLLPGAPRSHIQDIIKRFWEGGGRVFDTSPLYGSGEISVGDFASAMGITEKMFICNKIWSTGEFLSDDSHAKRSFEQSQQRLWREKIDLMQVHSLVNVDQIVPVLKNWKKEGKIRYVGVTHHEVPYFPALAGHVERSDLDFVQVHYSIQMRLAEERILPAAVDKGTAVLVNMPFEKARLFSLVQGRPLPDFAKEIGCENWAQYFLKWVISHPAITCVIPATSNPAHQSQNIGALRGPLPDKDLRSRMLKHMESIPGFDKLQDTAPYPGKSYQGLIRRGINARTAAAK
ncbi:MAG: aldo/keto reductase [Betaproteobacteria bacterium]|jgi:diketogulonate reductase-like aldo/keto reductase|nr:aldo/keto reductase [Betaproteobacteria bacterium]NBQ78622.1 aldo/keto reductase [Betaproteobacteria bacterium]NBQ94260.1 aldo/keto reductase [Betaproteobacteria bacterium]NBS39329.1 aldo/keto reductase [Betaproteobacteria bacterium]NBT82064.1 aldo/keto reductase [Betaproteobacteria bacterium]